jgi:hypothetical protein
METTINTRIKMIIKTLGFTVNGFAKTVGVSHPLLFNYTKERDPSFDFLNKLLNQFPNIDAEWLITGKGEMCKGNYQHNEVHTNTGVVGIQGDNNEINNKVIGITKNFVELLKNKDEQINNLIGIIKNYELWKNK